MSNHSAIEHRANYHFVKLEEDYIAICSQGKQYPHCKAFILAILEQWTNDKLAKGQSPYIYMTYPQWIDALYGLFRRNHIIDCLAELVQENLIFKQPCRLHGKDTFEYAMNVQEVQSRLAELTERTEKYTRPKINAFKFKRVEKQTGVNLNGSTDTNLNGTERDDPFKFGHNIDSITETPSCINSEREVADATTPAASSSFHFPQNDEERQQYNTFMRGARTEVTKANNGTRHSKTIKATISKRTPAKKETPPAISAEAIRIMDAWDSIFSRKCTRTENHIKAAELLVPCAPTRDDLSNIRKFCYKSNPKWYNDKGVSLIDVAKNFDKWQSLQEAPQVYEKNGHSPNGKMDYNAEIMDTSKNFIQATSEAVAEQEQQLAEREAKKREARR